MCLSRVRFRPAISAVKVSVRGRVFDSVRDDEGEPTVFELGRPARFVPAEPLSPSVLHTPSQMS